MRFLIGGSSDPNGALGVIRAHEDTRFSIPILDLDQGTFTLLSRQDTRTFKLLAKECNRLSRGPTHCYLTYAS